MLCSLCEALPYWTESSDFIWIGLYIHEESQNLKVKNISQEILEFIENNIMIPDERFDAALNKLPCRL